MSILRFTESKMVFSFDEADCFRIENSKTYETLGDGVKVCEFVSNNSGTIIFVEAKLSFSHPGNPGDFQADVDEIYQKFRNSLLLFAGILLGRPYRTAEQIPARLVIDSVRGAKCRCYLILNGHDDAWLVAVDDALNMRLAAIKRCFAVESVKVINEKIAQRHGLIQGVEIA